MSGRTVGLFPWTTVLGKREASCVARREKTVSRIYVCSRVNTHTHTYIRTSKKREWWKWTANSEKKDITIRNECVTRVSGQFPTVQMYRIHRKREISFFCFVCFQSFIQAELHAKNYTPSPPNFSRVYMLGSGMVFLFTCRNIRWRCNILERRRKNTTQHTHNTHAKRNEFAASVWYWILVCVCDENTMSHYVCCCDREVRHRWQQPRDEERGSSAISRYNIIEW